MLLCTMELTREHIEAFIKAYKSDIGEDISYKEAFEMAHRLVNVFLILEKAALQEREDAGMPGDTGTE
jgi:hypothetical protein